MASKGSKESPPPKDDAAVPADAAPRTDASDGLAEVEAVIDEAQRAAGAVSDGVNESAVDAVEQGLAGASSTGAADESSDAMNEIVAAIQEVESAQESTGKQASLKQYDDAIAGAVDDLLEGDFVSVDLVLEGMHETTPPPVPVKPKPTAEEPAAETSATPEAALEGEAATPEEVIANTSDADASAEAATNTDAAESSPQPGPSTPAPSADAENSADTTEDVEAADEAEAAAPAATSAEAAPAPRHKAPRSAAPAPAEEPASPRVLAALIAIGASLAPAAHAAVLAALRILSLPLRFVPARAREVVDWIALTLVFWVPIVWIFALFIVG